MREVLFTDTYVHYPVAAGLAAVTVPLRVTVYPLDLPAAPSIAIGGLDYTHLERTERDGGVVHQADFIAFLKRRLGDSFRFYRLFFNSIAILTLIPVLWYAYSPRR